MSETDGGQIKYASDGSTALDQVVAAEAMVVEAQQLPKDVHRVHKPCPVLVPVLGSDRARLAFNSYCEGQGRALRITDTVRAYSSTGTRH